MTSMLHCWPAQAAFSLDALVTGALNSKHTTSNQIETENVTATLLTHAPDGVKNGNSVLWLGLRLQHQAGWHTYWKNPGDSGLATQLNWTLPVGVEVGGVAWPTPKSIQIGDLTNYGYEQDVLLVVPVHILPSFNPYLLQKNLRIQLHAAWLVCKSVCLPEEGSFAIDIPTATPSVADAETFNRAKVHTPIASKSFHTTAVRSGSVLTITVQGLPKDLYGKKLQVFAEEPSLLVHNQTTLPSQSWRNETWVVHLPLSAQSQTTGVVKPMALVLAVAQTSDTGKDKNTHAIETPSQNTLALGLYNGWSFGLAMLAGLLGGLILNAMPCVFPILTLKAFSLVQKSTTHTNHKKEGWSYALGVVVSFVGLGGLMLLLRAGGEQLGWGFQLQSPWVLLGLSGLFCALALNLLGAFHLDNFLPDSVANWHSNNPTAEAFLTGTLAVVVASPCTGPFMGAALGAALTMPAGQALCLFAAMGIGMALPFWGLTQAPSLGKFLPKPGDWLVHFKQAMALPLVLTVVWLLWVLGQLAGVNAMALGLLFLIVLVFWIGFVVQVQKQMHLNSQPRQATWQIKGLVWLVHGLGIGMLVWTGIIFTQSTSVANVQLNTPSTDNTKNPQKTTPQSQTWQTWQPHKVQEALAQGRPVFVDFTAAWCITCQWNKKTTLSDAEVLQTISAKDVQLFRADWTKKDPIISQALAQLGRNGVPVYALYKPNQPVVILPELLTKDVVLTALKKP